MQHQRAALLSVARRMHAAAVAATERALPAPKPQLPPSPPPTPSPSPAAMRGVPPPAPHPRRPLPRPPITIASSLVRIAPGPRRYDDF